MSGSIRSQIQRLAPGNLVSLYTLDASMLAGGSIYYFCDGVVEGPWEPQLLLNSCLTANATGWTAGGNSAPTASGSAIAAGLTAFALEEIGSGYMRRSTGLPGTSSGFMEMTTAAQACSAGLVYEVNALVLPIRCRIELRLVFYNASDVVVGTLVSGYAENASGPSLGNYEGAYSRLYARGAAPATAVTMKATVRAVGVGGLGNAATDPYAYFSKVFFGGPVPVDADGPTEYAPFRPAGRIVFGGTTYNPVPMEVEGFEWTGRGPIPRPRIRITNVGNLGGQMAAASGDLLGAKLTRLRTFEKYLDGMPNADSGTYFQPDVWYFERKSQHSPVLIEWELSSVMDQEGKQLPGRQMLRDVCTHSYRYYVPGTGFSYAGVTCPYTDTRYFTNQDAATGDAAQDKCSKRLVGCAVRFAAAGLPLPTRAFPGLAATTMNS